jgi:hypothetical protein
MADVHTEHNQQRRENKGKGSKELDRGIGCRGMGNIKGDAHDFKSHPDLENIAT